MGIPTGPQSEEDKERRIKAAQYLGRTLEIERQIREVIEQEEEAERAGLSGIDYSRTGSRSADQTSRTEKLAIRAAELEDEHERLYLEWLDAQIKNLKIIQKVQLRDARAALWLVYYYIVGYPNSDVKMITGYSGEYCRRLKYAALDAAYEVMQEEANKQANGLSRIDEMSD